MSAAKPAPLEVVDDDRPSIFDQFVTAPELEEEGVWRTIDGWRFKVAIFENPRHKAVLARFTEAKLRSFENAELSDADFIRMRATIVGEGLLRDWDERFREPYSAETAIELLTKAPHLCTPLINVARAYQNFLQRNREQDSKNLPPA
jgi:hypothetical protein